MGRIVHKNQTKQSNHIFIDAAIRLIECCLLIASKYGMKIQLSPSVLYKQDGFWCHVTS